MHRSILLSTVGLVYYSLATYALLVFDAGILVTAFVLFMAPAALLAHYSYAPTPVVACVATLGLGMALILEGSAHMYGLWYSLGIDEGRLFGLIPAEAVIMVMSQVVFLALLYELMFDDGRYTVSSARTRFVSIGVLTLGIAGVLWVYQLFSGLLWVEYSFVWVLATVAAAAVAALGVHRLYSVLFFDRLVHFTLVGAIPILLSSIIAVANTHKVFANPAQYIHTVSLYGVSMPIEEIILSFTIAFFVAAMYEIYLDDEA